MRLSAAVKLKDGKENRENAGSACVLRSLDKEFALKRAVLFTRDALIHIVGKKKDEKVSVVLASVDSALKEHEPTCSVRW